MEVRNSTEPAKKDRGIHFYAHKGCKTSDANGIVPFNLVKINLGGGFNSSTAVFTAPKPGLYKFMLNGIKKDFDMASLHIYIRVNDVRKGESMHILCLKNSLYNEFF